MSNIKLNVLDKNGKPAGEIFVKKSVFGAERNEILIHEVAVALQNNQRQGTFSNLTMAEVRGHHKKPYRHKGTGNARQGTTKGPQFTGGGIVFAKKPRNFSTKINAKKKHLAFVSAVSGKIADGEFIVVKDLELKDAKTKSVVSIVEMLKIKDRVLFVNGYKPEFVRSARNIEKVSTTTPEQLSVLDIVTNKILVVSADAVREIEKQYSEQKEMPVVATPNVVKAEKSVAEKVEKTVAKAVKPTAKNTGRDGVFVDKNRNGIDDEIDGDNMKRGKATKKAGDETMTAKPTAKPTIKKTTGGATK
jgi:large subunit ribosomal protein L4